MGKHNFGYFIVEGVRNLFLNGFMSFAAICIIVACLVIMGSFTLVAVNLTGMIEDLEQESEIFAYVDETLSEAQARAIGTQLQAIPNVLSCEFITRETAMSNFLEQYEDSSLFDSVDASIFRHRFSVRLVDIERMSETVAQMERVNGIANVRAILELSEGFITARNIVGTLCIVLILILLIISVFIIANTIKLATFSRRDEIAIMKMCGATNGFIRWPFVYEGLLLGILGAVIAFFCQWGIYEMLTNAIVESDRMALVHIIPFELLAWRVGQVFLLTGFFVGIGGSLMTIRKFLRV